MKKRRNSLTPFLMSALSIATICFICLGAGCGEASTPIESEKATIVNASEIIIGTWQMSNFQINDPNAGSMAKDYAREIAPTIVYEFFENGTYTLVSATVSNPKEGTWKPGSVSNEILIQMGEEAKMFILIDKATEDHLWCTSQTTRMGDVHFQLTKRTE